MKKNFTATIASTLYALAGSSLMSSIFGSAKSRKPNRNHTPRYNSTEIVNHNAAIDAAKAEKKAAKRNRRHRPEDAAELARQGRIDEITTPRELLRRAK